ncbi:hypothetical protein [Megasphaera massiliensis]|uniref:hypothetical protein n=1 Tax=Megasphaera massiliensis TaxID=1232428 RepID=UPI003AF4FF0C
MSILKGILHHWNKTNKAYDTIHPETEVAQITDWNNGVVNTLASTALGSLVTTLSSDSLLAKLIGKVLTASGARYQSGPNGYICFGSYFGSHIIQWVSVNPGITTNSTSAIISLPIAFSEKHFCTILSDTAGRIAAVAGNDEGAFVTDRTLTSFRLFAAWSDGLNKEINAISIGV